MPKWVKVVLGVVLVLLLLVGGAVGAVFATSNGKLNDKYPVPDTEITVPTDEASLTEGKRLLVARGCKDCHGDDFGGKMEEMMPVMNAYAPNLTPGKGSAVAAMSDNEVGGIIRHGVRSNGSAVIFMPAHELWGMPDDEAAKLIAAMRKLPPVDRERQPTEIGPIGHMLNATDKMAIVPATRVDHTKARPKLAAPPAPEFGAYLAQGCIGCHGDNLSGGPIPGAPPELPTPTNITFHESGLGGYDLTAFMNAMRTGTARDGRKLDPFMPFSSYKAMTDAELEALWKHLETVEKRPFGER